jgi:hypothetical protein
VLKSPVAYFYSGTLAQFCSGVDTDPLDAPGKADNRIVIVGRQLNGLFLQGYAFLEFSRINVERAENIVSPGILGIQADRLFA